MSRIDEFEQNVAELADIVRGLVWGCHGDGNGHNRGHALAKKTREIVAKQKTEAVKVTKTGRKFR